MVVAFRPPAPARLADGAGFCAVAEAEGAALELTFGLEACAWAAVPAAVLVAAFVAVLVALEVAAFETAAVDSVEPANWRQRRFRSWKRRRPTEQPHRP